jgi:membrane fusion protein (multidrug efflux system)
MNARTDAPVESSTPAGSLEQLTKQPAKKRGGARRFILMFGVPVIIAAAGGYFYLTGGRYIDTDNAYVQQAKLSLSSDIAGRIVSVEVKENQVVKAGDVLFKLDDEPYRIALSQAEAALASAKVSIEQLRVSYQTAQAKLKAAELTLEVRQREFDRKQNLTGQGLATTATLDDTQLDYQSAQTSVALAKQEVAAASAALAGNPDIAAEDHPTVRAAQASLDAAKRNLEKTTIIAPNPGIISQVSSLNVGQFLAIGTNVATLVETGDVWVQANFKETQLAGLKVGMPAEVTVDAYPGVKFEGHIDSMGAATGSEFALVPAQNATGNWVKVTQRLSVRVALDDTKGLDLRSGMSAAIAADSGKSTLDGYLSK